MADSVVTSSRIASVGQIGGCRHAEEQQQHMRGRQRQDLFGEGEAGDSEQAEAQDRRQRISHAKRQS